ncbi:MAG: barstar family protein [Sterolibacteriaceae bacterium]|nr:barstar family protein [Candidatus Methylophosphatis haderslevensis]
MVEDHDALRAALPDEFATLIEIFAEAADYWREEDVPFWALLTPPTDGKRLLPSLEV